MSRDDSTATTTDALALAAAVAEVTARERAARSFSEASDFLTRMGFPLGICQRLMLLAALDDALDGLAGFALVTAWRVHNHDRLDLLGLLEAMDDMDAEGEESAIEDLQDLHDLFDMYAGHSVRVNDFKEERATA